MGAAATALQVEQPAHLHHLLQCAVWHQEEQLAVVLSPARVGMHAVRLGDSCLSLLPLSSLVVALGDSCLTLVLDLLAASLGDVPVSLGDVPVSLGDVCSLLVPSLLAPPCGREVVGCNVSF